MPKLILDEIRFKMTFTDNLNLWDQFPSLYKNMSAFIANTLLDIFRYRTYVQFLHYLNYCEFHYFKNIYTSMQRFKYIYAKCYEK